MVKNWRMIRLSIYRKAALVPAIVPNQYVKFVAIFLIPVIAVGAARAPGGAVGAHALRFGRIVRMLQGKHPHLDMTRSSASDQFHFVIGGGVPPAAGLPPTPPPYGKLGWRAYVVRDGSACAEILFLSSGATFYYVFDGERSLLVCISPSNPNAVLWASGGIWIETVGVVAPKFAARLNLPVGITAKLHFSNKPFAHPVVALRLFAGLQLALQHAKEIKFHALPVPSLYILAASPRGRSVPIRVVFRPGKRSPFPIRSMYFLVGDAFVSDIGALPVKGWPAMRKIRGFKPRSSLPWRTVTTKRMSGIFVRTFNPRSSRRMSAAYILLRKRFVKWATTPGSDLKNKTRSGKCASGTASPPH